MQQTISVLTLLQRSTLRQRQSFTSKITQRIMFLQTVLFSMSFSLALTCPLSSFTPSKNLLFGLPLFLFPGNSISIILLPTCSWSFLMTCPYHLNLPSLIFIPNRSTLTVPLMYSFLISLMFSRHSHSKPQHFHPIATSISSTCFFVTATVSSPYIIGGLTIELYIFLLL